MSVNAGFEFPVSWEPVRKVLPRKQRRGIQAVLVGTAGPYGELMVLVGGESRQAELSCPALPEASIWHPKFPDRRLIKVDEQTRLIVDGQQAVLSQNTRSLRKEDRALHIQLGDRHYSYVAVATTVLELREATRGTVIQISKMVVTVSPQADAIDLALTLILEAADMRALSVISTTLMGILDILDSGEGS